MDIELRENALAKHQTECLEGRVSIFLTFPPISSTCGLLGDWFCQMKKGGNLCFSEMHEDVVLPTAATTGRFHHADPVPALPLEAVMVNCEMLVGPGPLDHSILGSCAIL